MLGAEATDKLDSERMITTTNREFILYDTILSQQFADTLLKEGVYAFGFFFPAVTKGDARIRTQISAALSIADLDKAIAAFIKDGKELKLIN